MLNQVNQPRVISTLIPEIIEWQSIMGTNGIMVILPLPQLLPLQLLVLLQALPLLLLLVLLAQPQLALAQQLRCDIIEKT